MYEEVVSPALFLRALVRGEKRRRLRLASLVENVLALVVCLNHSVVCPLVTDDIGPERPFGHKFAHMRSVCVVLAVGLDESTWASVCFVNVIAMQ